MNVSVVVPTVNSLDDLKLCVDSLLKQSCKPKIIIVSNGSTDGTPNYVVENYPEIKIISFNNPVGFSGAVNAGIKHAMSEKCDFVALLNDDAIAEKNWIKHLVDAIKTDDKNGIATSKIKKIETNELDTTGDYYTSWFLPYPRGRGEIDNGQYDSNLESVSAASGGASLYRVKMLNEIGLFDEDFFAYYEDVDISLRAKHYGWKIVYTSSAIVNHKIGGTSKKIRGFTTFQAIKNLPLLYIKNVPFRLLLKYIHGFNLAYTMFIAKAFIRGHGFYAFKGLLYAIVLTPKKINERRKILKKSRLSVRDFDSLLVHDLPPNAIILRKLSKLLGFQK